MQFNLFVADFFELLANGKILAVGLFTDRVVVLPVSTDTPAASVEQPWAVDLGLLIGLTGVPTDPWSGQVEVIAPGGLGKPLGRLSISGGGAGSSSSTNVVSRLAPLMIPAIGLYTVRVTINGETLSQQFEVRSAPLHASPASKPVDPLGQDRPADQSTPAKKRTRTPKA